VRLNDHDEQLVRELIEATLPLTPSTTKPRRPLDAPTNLLETRVPEAAELPEDDQRDLLDHLDALLTRTRLRAITK
jgi:hypothetical protein